MKTFDQLMDDVLHDPSTTVDLLTCDSLVFDLLRAVSQRDFNEVAICVLSVFCFPNDLDQIVAIPPEERSFAEATLLSGMTRLALLSRVK